MCASQVSNQKNAAVWRNLEASAATHSRSRTLSACELDSPQQAERGQGDTLHAPSREIQDLSEQVHETFTAYAVPVKKNRVSAAHITYKPTGDARLVNKEQPSYTVNPSIISGLRLRNAIENSVLQQQQEGPTAGEFEHEQVFLFPTCGTLHDSGHHFIPKVRSLFGSNSGQLLAAHEKHLFRRLSVCLFKTYTSAHGNPGPLGLIPPRLEP